MPTRKLNTRADIEAEFDDVEQAICQIEDDKKHMAAKIDNIARLGRQALHDSDGNYKGVV